MSSQTVLVLSPHPDDESLGCGGTIRLLALAGIPVDVVFLTRGELGTEAPAAATPEAQHDLAGRRSLEAGEACRRLGVRGHAFLDGADGQLAEQPHLAGALADRLKAGGYTRVFCPWPGEAHPDHAATYDLLRRALPLTAGPVQVWLYEVWTPLRPSVSVPIDDTMADKEAAIRRHISQLACRDYLAAFRGLAAYRALSCPPCRFAEAFVVLDREGVT
jgi:LmbE family N-acetylglucosaminyl deacetylase